MDLIYIFVVSISNYNIPLITEDSYLFTLCDF